MRMGKPLPGFQQRELGVPLDLGEPATTSFDAAAGRSMAAAMMHGSDEDIVLMPPPRQQSSDANAGRALAEMMFTPETPMSLLPPGVEERAPEELLELGLIDNAEYRQRIGDPTAAHSPPLAALKLTAARSQGSVAVVERPTPSARNSLFADEMLGSHRPRDGLAELAPAHALVNRGRAMTFDDFERELDRVQSHAAHAAEALNAKEMVLQEVFAQLAQAKEQLHKFERGGGQGAPAASNTPSRGRPSKASAKSGGRVMSYEELEEALHVKEQALARMAEVERTHDKEARAVRARLEPPSRAPLHPDVQEAELGSWTLAGFVDSLRLSDTIAHALIEGERASRAGGWFGDKDAAAKSDLDFVKGLAANVGRADAGRQALVSVLSKGGSLEKLAEKLMSGIESLAATHVPGGTAKIGAWSSSTGGLNKFLQDESAIMMSYASLSTFFSGLEGKVGSPDPKVREAMLAEHCQRPDSDATFTAGNYGVNTTSAIEWRFVDAPSKPPSGGWPVETRNTHVGEGSDAVSIMRATIPRDELHARLTTRNARLSLLGEPELQLVEAVGARLYTGPMFAKYNSVLRGLDSEVAFLKSQMVELCCAKDVAERFAAEALPYEQVRADLNTYTTTLHCINSSIVKLSKLTYAAKVYRGVNGRKLPPEFWQANEYGVRGGIEGAFMSTTTDRGVALAYARGDGDKAGIVFEIQQGMVDRGAELTFLSQYPHEAEILFAPLAGFEVKYTRVEGQVLVVVVSLAVNLTAQTIEQVISKRRKIMVDMCDQMAINTRQVATTDDSWEALREIGARVTREHAPVGVAERFLRGMRSSILAKPPEHYNVNANLVDEAGGVLNVADAVAGWGDGLQELLDDYCALNNTRASLVDLFSLESLQANPKRLTTLNAAYGIAALIVLSTALTELIVDQNQLGDTGVAAIAAAIGGSEHTILSDLFLAHTGAGERAAKALVKMLATNRSLKRLNIRGNPDILNDAELVEKLERACFEHNPPVKLIR